MKEPMSNFRDQFADKFETLGGLKPLFGKFNPLNTEELAQIEKDLGVRLPEQYRGFLLEIGGVRFGAMPLVKMMQSSPRGGPDSRETFNYFFGAETEKHLALQERIGFFSGRISDKVIPIGADLMGNLTCLAIKGKRRGRVYFWDHDCGKLYLAATSFDDFLNRLEPYQEPPPRPIPNLSTLLDTEWRHLGQRPSPQETPWNSLCNQFVTSGNAELILARIHEVMKLINIVSRGTWPDDWHAWEKILPKWFLSKCTLEASKQDVDPWLNWLPPNSMNPLASDRRAEMDRPWPLEEWVYWMAPERRKWFWWEGVLVNEMNLEIHVEICEWPLPDAALDWLGRAAGAYRRLAGE